MTHRLVWATWFAFGAAILVFLWQIVLWYYPTHKDFVRRNEIEKLPPKKP
jgi:Na+/pantothenate symporter